MSKIFVSAALWLVIVLSAHAKSTVIRITPDAPQAGGFLFAVTNIAASNGLAFSITITATGGELPVDSYCWLCVATLKTNSGSIKAIPGTQVTAKKKRGTLKANFVASDQLLSNADTSFVFAVKDPRGPATDFYVLKLRDFIKQRRNL